MSKIVYTIGHSTRTIEDFIKLIKTYRIKMVVDVRTIPGSHHNPQYNEELLNNSLNEHNISYKRMKGLGGLRHTTKMSMNNAWKNSSFRSYADYMQTSEFAKSIKHLIKIAKEKQIALMCAEAVPWRCHRSLIGDALVIRNIIVEDIISEKSCKPHKLTQFAHVVRNTITYPKVGKEKLVVWTGI